MTRKRILELDLLRAFACLAVIGIHTFAKFQLVGRLSKVSISALALDNLCCFAVPMFIFISGLVLFYNNSTRISPVSFYWRRVLSVVPQYITFSIFYLIVRDWQNITNSTTTITLKSFVTDILEAKSSYHMWFFAILFQFYLLFPIFRRLYLWAKDKHRTDILLFLALLIQVVWSEFFYYYLAHTLGPEWLINFLKVYQLFALQLFPFFLGMFVGDHINSNYMTVLRSIKLSYFLVLACVLWLIYTVLTVDYYFLGTGNLSALGQTLFNPVISIVYFIVLYKISTNLVKKNNFLYSVLASIGKYSFGIFMIHIFLLNLILEKLAAINITPAMWEFYPIVFFLTLIASYLIIWLLSYLPGSKYIVGTHTRLIKQSAS